jgi:3-dehydroquinate synthase
VIKYAVLKGEPLLSLLADPDKADWTEIITRCVSIKRDIVEEDEFDTGMRMLLNLGHTVGHAIEKKSHFGVSHGSAVAMGTVIAARISEKLGLCQKGLAEQIKELLVKYGLPTDSPYPGELLKDSLLSDKKRTGDTLHLILPKGFGDCVIYPVAISELSAIFETIL